MDKPLVIYHGNCADGFTAAWLMNMWVFESLGNAHMPDDWVVDHHGAVYGETPPDCTGREVYILDFSYSAEDMDKISEQAKMVVNIDHHETAIRRLAGHDWPNVVKVFDISRSGAYLTSLYCWPEMEPSDMVQMVDDRDRWQFHKPDTRNFSAGLFSKLYTIADWNDAAVDTEGVIIQGEAIERKHHKDIDELLLICTRLEKIGLNWVPVANLPYTMASDACEKLLKQYPDAPFAATWYLRADGKKVYSLRSRPSGHNVAKVAEGFGGGGHAGAAGFAVES